MSWSQFEPSFVLKTGSSPWVASKRALSSSADRLQPWAGRWHDPQLRPLAPRGWKNGAVRSMGWPRALYVANKPELLGKGYRLGKLCPVALDAGNSPAN